MPLAVLFVGITGSGKTTVAQALADHGFTGLSVDEEVHRLHGRYGIDYPEHSYFERERPVVEAIRQRLLKELEAGTTSSWTTGCGSARTAKPGRMPPARPAVSRSWSTSPPTAPNCSNDSPNATNAKTPTP